MENVLTKTIKSLKIIVKLPIVVHITSRIQAATSIAVNKKMQPNKTLAGRSGCERLREKIAFRLGCTPSTKTMTRRLAIKMEMKIQHNVIEMVTAFEITILMRMAKVTANKPGGKCADKLHTLLQNGKLRKSKMQLTVNGEQYCDQTYGTRCFRDRCCRCSIFTWMVQALLQATRVSVCMWYRESKKNDERK